MGVCIELWRARVGCFTQRRGGTHPRLKTLLIHGGFISRWAKLVCIVGLLLQLAGDVELNPGPKGKKGSGSQSVLTVSEGNVRVDSQAKDTQGQACDTSVQKALAQILSGIQSELRHLNTRFDNFEKSLESVKRGQDELVTENEKMKRKLSDMEVRFDNMEAQQRRDNLLFFGVAGKKGESWEESESKVREILTDTLKIDDAATIQIERAHRLQGARDPRPIIAKFNSYKDKQRILTQARQVLKGSDNNLRVSEDFTKRVRDERRELVEHMKEARDEGSLSYLSYNKLVIDNRVYVMDREKNELRQVGTRPIRDDHRTRGATGTGSNWRKPGQRNRQTRSHSENSSNGR
jgi:hypothetical protein